MGEANFYYFTCLNPYNLFNIYYKSESGAFVSVARETLRRDELCRLVARRASCLDSPTKTWTTGLTSMTWIRTNSCQARAGSSVANRRSRVTRTRMIHAVRRESWLRKCRTRKGIDSILAATNRL